LNEKNLSSTRVLPRARIPQRALGCLRGIRGVFLGIFLLLGIYREYVGFIGKLTVFIDLQESVIDPSGFQ
jgi:hypothetical protein